MHYECSAARTGLHDYEVIRETDRGIFEKCKRCGTTLSTDKDQKGQIDNTTYLKEHQRDFLQPNGRTARLFKEEYGSANYDFKPKDE